MENRISFPFTAIIGQEKAKQALLITMINPKAGALLLGGSKGSAKSTLVRSMDPFLPGHTHVELPLNVTEDMLFGSMDLEYALVEGKRRFLPGLLARAEHTVLYIDEVNLLQREFLTAVLDASSNGFNIVERDGISFRHSVQYTVIGTMNPEEGTLPTSILDRFGMYVETAPVEDVEDRVAIIKKVLAFESNAGDFVAKQQEQQYLLSMRIKKARQILATSEVSLSMIQLAAQMCAQCFCPGHRAELYLLEAARSIAALDGRDYVLPRDMDEAAQFVLLHRMRKPPELEEKSEEMSETENTADDTDSQPPESEQEDSEESSASPEVTSEDEEQSEDQQADLSAAEETSDENFAPEESVATIDKNVFMPKMLVDLGKDRLLRRGSGKRSVTKTDLKQGRYVRAAVPKGKTKDFAFDATIRAAAPHQKNRCKNGCAIVIHEDDLREKVREKRIGSTFLFLVDASGSMGARERMKAVKGAIFSMLQEAYEKRDKVGMVAFRRDTAEVLLPITRSVDLAQKCLRELPTGGKTPLAEGISTALSVLTQQRRNDKDQQPVLVLITDGRTNGGDIADKDPVACALEQAEKIRDMQTAAVVIDTETDFIKLGIAKALARKMGATYYSLRKLSKEQVLHIVRNIG